MPWMTLAGFTACLVSVFCPGPKFAAAWFVSLALQLACQLWRWPQQENHMNYMTIVNIFLIFAYPVAKKERDVLPYFICWTAGVMYFWAAIHKLNFDFFNPDVSCANRITMDFLRGFIHPRFPISLVPTSLMPFLIVFTELGIALALLNRRSFPIAVAAGIVMHVVLGHLSYMAFSTVASSVFIFGLLYYSNLSSERRKKVHQLFVWYFWVMLAIGVIYAFARPQPPQNSDNIYSYHAIPWTLFMFLFLRVVLSPPEKVVLPRPFLSHRGRAFIGGAVLSLLFFGSFNYLGLSTAGTFSMYSNITTENGRWNHFFIPSAIKVFSYQDHIFQYDFNGASFGVVSLELRRWMQEANVLGSDAKSLDVIDSKNQMRYKVIPYDREGDAAVPMFQAWEQKFLHFRNVQVTSGPNICRW